MNTFNNGAGKILIVEDEPVICKVCQRVLVKEGFEVDVAVDGEAAQGMMGRQDYDLYLVDVRTPVMNGKQLYQYIEDEHPELVNRVIFTTGDLIGDDTQGFLKLTGRPCLPKPFTSSELKDIVRETLMQVGV